MLHPPHNPDVPPQISPEATPTPKPLTVDRLGGITSNAED